MAQTVRNGAPELLERNDLDMVWIEIAAACRGTVKEFVKAARSCSNPQSGEPVDRLKFEEGTFRIQDRRGNFPHTRHKGKLSEYKTEEGTFLIQDRRGNFPNTRQNRELSEYKTEEGTFRIQDIIGIFPNTRQKRKLSEYKTEEETFRIQDRRGNFPNTRQKRELSEYKTGALGPYFNLGLNL